jgi:FtsH-binding integral membrane protein
MALIGIVIAALVNRFVGSTALQLVVSADPEHLYGG